MTNKEWLKQHPEFEYFLKLWLHLIPFDSDLQKKLWVAKLEGILDANYTI